MTYLVQAAIAENQAMLKRVAQAAAEQGLPGPPPEGTPFGGPTTADQWALVNARIWAAAPGWDDAWASAEATYANNPNYDPGLDEAVITDAMILSQVQAMAPAPE